MSLPAQLVTTYLHMTDPAQFRPADLPPDELARHDAQVQRLGRVDVPYYRFLYGSVGAAWHWTDRARMSDDALHDCLLRAQVYVLSVAGVPAGYVELGAPAEREGARSVEVAYFGLRPAFIGQGWGRFLLSYGVARAWEAGAERVWLHTCNLDSPAALPNYQARGFVIYQTTREPIPAHLLG